MLILKGAIAASIEAPVKGDGLRLYCGEFEMFDVAHGCLPHHPKSSDRPHWLHKSRFTTCILQIMKAFYIQYAE